MDFEFSERCKELRERLLAFMDEHIHPNESVYEEQLRESPNPHSHPPVMEELKEQARAQGLWNLFLPHGAPDDSAPGRDHRAHERTGFPAHRRVAPAVQGFPHEERGHGRIPS